MLTARAEKFLSPNLPTPDTEEETKSLRSSASSRRAKPKPCSNSETLLAFGKMIAVDMCFNMWDRMPTLTKSEGNPHNMLFKIKKADESQDPFVLGNCENVQFETDGIVAIDNWATPMIRVDNQANFDAYLEKVDSFLSLMFIELVKFAKNPEKVTDWGDEQASFSCLTSTVKCMFSYTNYWLPYRA
jgi:hypothetical protein